MAATATPSIYDYKILYEGALTATPNTVVYTSPAGEAGAKLSGLIVNNTGAATRIVSVAYKKATARVIFSRGLPPGDGLDVLGVLGLTEGMIIDASDIIQVWQDAGTDVNCVIFGPEMKD